MKKYELIEHTADIGIIGYGKSLEEAFSNVAVAMFELMVNPVEVSPGICKEININAYDQQSLLVAWLNELLYLVDVENIIFNKFEVTGLTATELKSKNFGEKIIAGKHHFKMGIKAATYHLLKIEKNDIYQVQVIFDV